MMTIQGAIALASDIYSTVEALSALTSASIESSQLLTDRARQPGALKSGLTELGQLLTDLANQTGALKSGLIEIGLAVGAGLYPNTFVKDDVYLIVHNLEEQHAAAARGYVVAAFPQTMTKAGSPALVVNSEREKDRALQAGYSLPGLSAQS